MDDLSDLDSEEDESEAGITGGATAAPVDGTTEDSSSSAASCSGNSDNAKNSTDATRLCGEDENSEKKDSECGRKFIIPLESNVESDMENKVEMMDFEIKVEKDNDSRPSDVSDKNELSEMHKDNEEVGSKETEEKNCVQAESVASSSEANNSEVMICSPIGGL